MFGAISGDVIGSVYERQPVRHTDFPLFPPRSRFTDDTVLTVATAYAILEGLEYREAYLEWGRRYPHAGYGPGFKAWLQTSDPPALGSYGNGSAMRVSPVGFAFDGAEEVLRAVRRTSHTSGRYQQAATNYESSISRTSYDLTAWSSGSRSSCRRACLAQPTGSRRCLIRSAPSA